MEPEQYLIDTNVIIDYLGEKLPPKAMDFMHGVVNAVPNVSVISRIELLGFSTNETAYQVLNGFMEDATVLDLTEDVADQSINIRKSSKTKLPDAIIAATAIVYNLILITRNVHDFKSISGLRVLNPWVK
jgi:predicted nucleic acid-binding protein